MNVIVVVVVVALITTITDTVNTSPSVTTTIFIVISTVAVVVVHSVIGVLDQHLFDLIEVMNIERPIPSNDSRCTLKLFVRITKMLKEIERLEFLFF